MSNADLIERLREYDLDSDSWEAADALELADKRIAEEREQHDIMMERGAEKLAEAERKLAVARDELLRCKRIMLRECGIGVVDENVLAQIGGEDARS